MSHIKGNYFHDNGTSAGGHQYGGRDNDDIEDNVWVCTCIYPWSIQAFATHEYDLPAQHVRRRWRHPLPVASQDIERKHNPRQRVH